MLLDETLILKISNNDMEALREFYDATNQAIFGFALSITKNLHDAEDVLQETYLKVRANAAGYEPQGKPMAWVFTITRNLCLMKLRNSNRETQLDETFFESACTYSHIQSAEDRLLLQGIMTVLSDEERQIVILHAVCGFKHREIAKLLKIPLSTVLSKNSRAIKKSKNYLALQGGDNHETR